jgi:O-acetyl-ADP-ribose deacetylase (regulator of RNase III)
VNIVQNERELPGERNLQLVQGDITVEEVDAIVNAANQGLRHAGGLARAIAERGGPAIQRESDAWVQAKGPVSHAHPAWTSGGFLPARYVIHAVGPIWGTGDEGTKLAAAVTGALHAADELGLASIALPAISTGIYGFPADRAAKFIFAAIQEYFQENPDSSLKLVKLVLFDTPTMQAFTNAWDT